MCFRRSALRLMERLDLKGKIVTGDALFWQKSLTAKIVEGGGDYVFPVKDNPKNLKDDIETAFNAPVFPPVPAGIAASRRRMGVSNAARSTCCPQGPRGSSASGRQSAKSAA